jgi:simple sugar transport system ATP-binding protein
VSAAVSVRAGEPIVQVVKGTKRYGGTAAIDEVDFSIHGGEIHCLVGENGAGKSTLMKCISGTQQLSSGQILIDGKPALFQSPADGINAGIAMVYQETSLVPYMTVAQNIFLGDEKLFNRLRGLNIAAQQVLQSMNFVVDPSVTVFSLGAAKKQMVEIAKAVRARARIIVFDEPTASLTPEEKDHFFDHIRVLRERGIGIVFISHALEETLAVGDRITVMRDGKHILTKPAKELTRDDLIKNMVGRALEGKLYSHRGAEAKVRKRGEKVLSVENLTMGKIVKNNSFSIYAGQITGMFGLVGSGRTETAKIIVGALKRNFFSGGKVFLGDREVRYRVPGQAVHDGIAYVTEDRKVEGFFETMSIADNIGIGFLASTFGHAPIVAKKENRKRADELRKRLNVRALSNDAKVVELSGGNQQKVVIANSLVQKPKVIIFDEPTRGVDVGAIEEIHQLLNDLADEGLAVVVISSYMPEILNLSDRILVMREGRVVEEFDVRSATPEAILYAAVH